MSEVNVSARKSLFRLPRLFKKTNTGAIQYWDISVSGQYMDNSSSINPDLGEIITIYGQFNTDKPQVTKDIIREGKNAGKKNATSAYEQSLKEAKAKWDKQLKKGYVETEEAAQAEETNALIEGGIFPMLAQPYSKHSAKIKWPCYVQPKLDGIRCIAVVQNGVATLWSRTRKQITSMPHIISALEENFTDIILDGELYNHKFKQDFEKIVSLVRQESPADGCEIVQYHVYDMVSDKIFADRQSELVSQLATTNWDVITPVQTVLAQNEDQVAEMFIDAKSQGFEGVMLRNGDSLYEQNKRSYSLQKVKEFEDAEFEVVGIDEGRGKLAGHVGAFICRTKDGKEFMAKMSGDTSKLKDYFDNKSLWQGKLLTVQYQGLTGKEGVPRFPVGLRIRDYE